MRRPKMGATRRTVPMMRGFMLRLPEKELIQRETPRPACSASFRGVRDVRYPRYATREHARAARFGLCHAGGVACGRDKLTAQVFACVAFFYLGDMLGRAFGDDV